MIDLADTPLIDNHVHIFAPDVDQPSFDPMGTFTLGGDDPGFLEVDGRTLNEKERSRLTRNLRHSMAYQGAMLELAGFLGCAPEREAVLAARAEHLSDFPAYVRKLYADVNLGTVIVDTGNPLDVDLEAFARLTDVPTYGIFRIEVLIWRLWEVHDDFDAFVKAYLDMLQLRCAETRIVSLKSVIAYRTGLAVEMADRDTACTAFTRLKGSAEADGLLRRVHVPRPLFGLVKTLRDYLLCQALELSIELHMPFQIHTGLGDQDLDIATARPGFLGAVFRDPKLRHARIVMLHGSYPFYAEGAYLANIFPNVYLDLSLFNPWLGYNSISHVMTSILDLAPFTKLLYASDAYGSPEMQWLAGRNARTALASTFGTAISAARLTADEARTATRLILAENAQELYEL